jgi:hypothetical protein
MKVDELAAETPRQGIETAGISLCPAAIWISIGEVRGLMYLAGINSLSESSFS